MKFLSNIQIIKGEELHNPPSLLSIIFPKKSTHKFCAPDKFEILIDFEDECLFEETKFDRLEFGKYELFGILPYKNVDCELNIWLCSIDQIKYNS